MRHQNQSSMSCLKLGYRGSEPCQHPASGLVASHCSWAHPGLVPGWTIHPLQAMEQKILGRDAVLAKLKTAIERPQSAQASEDRQLSRMSRSFRASKKQVWAGISQHAPVSSCHMHPCQ